MNIISKILIPVKRVVLNTSTCSERRFTKEAKKFSYKKEMLANAYSTNLENKIEPPAFLTYCKEKMVRMLLEKGEYSFRNILVLNNPYKISPLSAIMVFNTDEECKVEYTIRGRLGSEDYTKCDETVTKYHRVPVLGLYEGCFNKVRVRLLNPDGTEIDSKNIKIRTPQLNEPVHNCVKITKSQKPFTGRFIFVSGGYKGGVYAFDSNGNIRFALNRIPQYYGVYLFKDGRFLFPEKNMRIPAYGNAHTVITHEMDMLGRVYHTYHQKKGMHHWAIEKEPGGNILGLSSSMTDSYMENAIVEIDRKTGETIYELSMNELFDDTYKTRNDWAHINSIDYIPEEGSVVVSMRNVHTIAKINLKNREIVWLIANPKFYKGTNVENKVLKPVGEHNWFFQQHGIQIVHDETDNDSSKLRVMLFDNHTANRRPVKWFDNEEKSYVVFYTIDEKNRTVTQDARFQTPLSITRSNSEYDADKKVVKAMCAHFKPPIDGYDAKIYEFDYVTKECINEISCITDFFSAHTFDFNIPAMAKPVPIEDGMMLGQLVSPVCLENIPDELESAAAMPDDVSDALKFRRYGDLIQIYAVDHDLEKIYLYSDDTVFVQDFTNTTQPLNVFKTQKYFVNMPLNDIPAGSYKLAIQYLSKTYKTDYTVAFEKRDNTSQE
ncbi:MAG TPA: hypothetical protein DCZ23_04660 [Lachnospiraceae bacterium]|nr:hypothetical protein [Lachnospiraceae bacterium]